MFSHEPMSVVDWWIYFILMVIPVVNVILFIMILLSPTANKSVRSLEFAVIVPMILFGVFFMNWGFPQGFNGPF